MRKSTVLNVVLSLLFLFEIVFGQNLKGQTADLSRKYTFVFLNEPLDSVITQLQKSADLGFSYNPEILTGKSRFTRNFTNESLKLILDSIFIPNHLKYEVIGRNIAIARCQKNSEPTVSASDTGEKKIYQYSGRIIDEISKAPVSFANIYIKSKGIGIISNIEGYFIIKIPTENITDSLYFSCLGYKTSVQSISNLSPENNLKLLKPVPVMIKEVVVKYIDPKTILKKAIENIPQNYSKKAIMNTAFYRETVKENNSYVSLSEAILHIYKAPYNNFSNDQISIFKGRKSPFVKQMDTLFFKFQGGLTTCLLLDIAKNPSNFLSDEYIGYYDFKMDDIVTLQDHATYVIAFDQKDDAPYPLYKGKLYIDRKTSAIVRADFMISPKGMDNAANELVRKTPRHFKVKPLVARYLVNYTEHNNIWSLSNIREELSFKVHKRFSFFSRTYGTTAELVITKSDSTDVHRFRIRDTVHSDDVFTEKVGEYDEIFWGDYNFIKPDESMEEALMRVEQKLKELRETKK